METKEPGNEIRTYKWLFYFYFFESLWNLIILTLQTAPPRPKVWLLQDSAVQIDLFHNGGQIKHSFVLMLISLSSLATTSKFQKNVCFKMRAVGLINIKTRECKSGHHLWKWSIWKRIEDLNPDTIVISIPHGYAAPEDCLKASSTAWDSRLLANYHPSYYRMMLATFIPRQLTLICEWFNWSLNLIKWRFHSRHQSLGSTQGSGICRRKCAVGFLQPNIGWLFEPYGTWPSSSSIFI